MKYKAQKQPSKAFKIDVVQKNTHIDNTISVRFNKIKETNKRVVISCSGFNPANMEFKVVDTALRGRNTTSTALSYWISDVLQKDLRKLLSNISVVKDTNGNFLDVFVYQNIYGLYYDQKMNKVLFNERIGMSEIKKIMQTIGYNILENYEDGVIKSATIERMFW